MYFHIPYKKRKFDTQGKIRGSRYGNQKVIFFDNLKIKLLN